MHHRDVAETLTKCVIRNSSFSNRVLIDEYIKNEEDLSVT